VVHGVGANVPLSAVVTAYEVGVCAPGEHISQHAWLVAPDGAVVDPTAQQYGPGPVHRWALRDGLRWDPERHMVCLRCRTVVPYGADELGIYCCGLGRLGFFLATLAPEARAEALRGRP